MKINRIVQDALDSLPHGIKYTLKNGGSHVKIFIGETFAGIMPKNGTGDRDKRTLLNTRAQIRRAAQIEQERRNGNGQHTRA